ncbi:MAG: response regulator [Bacteroidetes bacterium]|nr:MAG: response regulator [Bacteroidota bacterium]
MHEKKRILVVEDDEVNLMIAEHILGREGYEVAKVNNGEEAIEIVRNQQFDMILMDIEMPIMDGLEATPLIRKLPNGRHVPIIALTAHSMPEKIEEFHKAGMDSHIIKPIDQQKLKVVTDKYL